MTPTQAFLAAAKRTWDVTDSLGRTLTLHQLTALDRLKLFKAVPPHSAWRSRSPSANPSPRHPQSGDPPIPSQTPGQAAAALANLPITETLTTALDAAAARLADAIRAELATPPGGPHDHPWRQTGALQASIAHNTTGLTAQIGSGDPAAAAQEYGTATIPPRPFLAPAAATLAEPIVHDIATALTTLLARALN